MKTTFTQTHATNYCGTPCNQLLHTPPQKVLIFKGIFEILSFFYLKGKVINKIVTFIQKTKCVKNDKRFNFYTKQPPISPVGRNGGINGATRLDAPHGAGGVPPPLSC